jgi:hypothetical protein
VHHASIDIDVPETTPAWIDRPIQDTIISCIEDKTDEPIIFGIL